MQKLCLVQKAASFPASSSSKPHDRMSMLKAADQKGKVTSNHSASYTQVGLSSAFGTVWKSSSTTQALL